MASKKSELIDDVIREFRIAGNHDVAFDVIAAEHLGVNATDLACLNIIESRGGLTAGELAAAAGLTTGAVTGVVDRLDKIGYARRVPDPDDRRRVKVEVTPEFYTRAREVWGPVGEDWSTTLAERFTGGELARFADFLRTTSEITERHIERLRAARPA